MWGIQQASTWPNLGLTVFTPRRRLFIPCSLSKTFSSVTLLFLHHFLPFFLASLARSLDLHFPRAIRLFLSVFLSLLPTFHAQPPLVATFTTRAKDAALTATHYPHERQPQWRHDTSKRKRSTARLDQPVFHAKSAANGTATASSEPDGHSSGHSSDGHGFWPQWSTSISASTAGAAAATTTEFYAPKYPAVKPDSGLHASSYVLTHRRWSSQFRRKYDTAWKQHRASCNLPAPHKSIGAYASRCISHGYEPTPTTSNATTTTAAANGYVTRHVHDDEAGRASWHASQSNEGATCSSPTGYEQFDPSSVHESGFASRWNAAIPSPKCVFKWHASATSTTIITETKFPASESCR